MQTQMVAHEQVARKFSIQGKYKLVGIWHAAIAALVIALITVSFQTIKAAVSNPVKSLRTE